MEVLPLNSGASVRLFQIFKAQLNKVRKHKKRTKLTFELEDLKRLLGIGGKYADYRNFRKRVLEVVQKEINTHTYLQMKYTPVKAGYTIVKIEFEFWDLDNKETKAKRKSKRLQLDTITYAQAKAYDILVLYGVNEGIALEMISKAKGSELIGFEDWYFEAVIAIFETKTRQTEGTAKSGTLVNWFLKKKIFEQGDHFAKVMENLQARKKQQQKEQPTAWDNRLLAKTMTSAAFTKRFKS